MNPLYKLLSIVKGAVRHARIAPDQHPEVESLTAKKFIERVRGGWLFGLVIQVAAGYYGEKPESYQLDEDIVRDVNLRIEGLARVVARTPENASTIAALAREELDHRIQHGYLVVMAKNESRNLVRKEQQERTRQADPVKADDAAYLAFIRAKRPTEQPISGAERYEKIRLTFGPEAGSPAHELLAFAWDFDRTPQAIVEDLGTLTLAQLAGAWVQLFAEIEQRDLGEVEELFEGMTRQAAHQRLFEFWDPLDTIGRWIQKVSAELAKRGRTRHSLRMRVAYLYNIELQYTTWRIAAQLGFRRVDQLAADFAPEYASRTQRTAEEVRRKFAPLLQEDKTAAEPLSDAFKPHTKVIEWQWNVRRRLERAEHEQLESGLRLILSSGIEPWKTMAFLHCHCLGKTPNLIAQRYGTQPLKSMREGLHQDFAKRWEVSPEYVKRSLSTLGQALLAAGPSLTLQACIRKDADLVRELQVWKREVLAAVEAKFAVEPRLRLFALRHNLPPAAVRERTATA